MRCSTLPGAAAQQSRAEAPLPPSAYVPPAVSRRGRRQRASSDAHQKPKAASNSIFRARAVVNRSAAGGAAGVRVAQDWSRASVCKTLEAANLGSDVF